MGTRFMRLFLYGVLVAVFLAACGGGGSQSIPSIEYNGNPAPAMINSTNAEEIALAAYEGNTMGSEAISPLSTGASGGSPDIPVLATVLRIVRKSAAGAFGGGTVSALASQSYPGTCTGIDPGSITISENSSGTSGTLIFDNYCEDLGSQELVMDGKVTGSVSVSRTNNSKTYTFTFYYLKITFRDSIYRNNIVNQTVAGRITETDTFDDLFEVILRSSSTTNMSLQDHIDGERVYRIENYTTTTDYVNYTRSISGRYYHNYHGFVDISTLTPKLSLETPYPNSGVLEIVSSNGSKAKIDFGTSFYYTCNLWVDEDGTGYVGPTTVTLY